MEARFVQISPSAATVFWLFLLLLLHAVLSPHFRSVRHRPLIFASARLPSYPILSTIVVNGIHITIDLFGESALPMCVHQSVMSAKIGNCVMHAVLLPFSKITTTYEVH